MEKIELKNFCYYDHKLKCYIISDDYNVSIFSDGSLLRRRGYDEYSEEYRSNEEETHFSRIEYAYIGTKKIQYQTESLVNLLRKNSNYYSGFSIIRRLEDPVFNKVVKYSPAYQHVEFGWFLTDDEMQFDLKLKNDIQRCRVNRNEDYSLERARFFSENKDPKCCISFYKDIFKAFPHLDPEDRWVYGKYVCEEYDIKIESKDCCFYISEMRGKLYPVLYKLIKEGVVDNPKRYEETRTYRYERDIRSDMEGYGCEENIRESIAEFKSMMDAEGGWENMD